VIVTLVTTFEESAVKLGQCVVAETGLAHGLVELGSLVRPTQFRGEMSQTVALYGWLLTNHASESISLTAWGSSFYLHHDYMLYVPICPLYPTSTPSTLVLLCELADVLLVSLSGSYRQGWAGRSRTAAAIKS
jgi:hypothetical protein